ncbi:MAG: lipopolysaccharide biosynthesis protein [Lysobacter sp.]
MAGSVGEALVMPPGLRRAAVALSSLSLATAVGAGMVFLTQTILARQLGAADYGLFASSLATVTIVAPLAGFGLSRFRLMVYGVEGWGADRWLRSTLRFSAITTALALAIVVACAFTIAPGTATRFTLLVLLPVILALLATDLVGNKLRLEERYHALSGWLLLIPGGRLAIASLLLLVPALDVSFVAVGYGLLSLAIFAFGAPAMVALMRGEVALHGHGPRPATPKSAVAPGIATLWSQSWVYGVTALLYPVFFQVGTVLLKYLDSNVQAGLFGIAMAVMSAIYLIPSTIYQKYLLSKLHRWAVHDKPKFRQVYRQGIAGMFGLGLLVGATLALLAPWLVPVAFGQQYRGVVAVLLVLALCPPLRFLSTAVGAALLNRPQMGYRVRAMALAALVTVVFNVVLIPHYHALGAAFATIGGEIALLSMMARGAWRCRHEYAQEPSSP